MIKLQIKTRLANKDGQFFKISFMVVNVNNRKLDINISTTSAVIFEIEKFKVDFRDRKYSFYCCTCLKRRLQYTNDV